MHFTIRDYRAPDFDRLWQIDQLCFPSGIAYTQMELDGFITARNATTLVAEEHEDSPSQQATGPSQIAGFVVAHSVRNKLGRILTLDVDPERRRFGLGSALIAKCEERLRERGCSEIYLETAVNNQAAIHLYHRQGYEIVRTLADYYASHSLDAFLMRKNLWSRPR